MVNCSAVKILPVIYLKFLLLRTENANLPHTLATIEVAQYFSNYFVNEARKSTHVFGDTKDIISSLIENYTPVYTQKDGSNYFQAYLFNRNRDM